MKMAQLLTTDPLPITSPPRWLQLAVWIIGLGYPLLMGIWMMLVPAAGLVGLGLLGLTGAVCCWLVWRRGVTLLTTPLDSGILALVAAAGLSAVLSIDPSRSWRLVWLWIAVALVFYLAVIAFRSGWSPRLFSAGLYVMTAVLLLSAYFQLFLYLQPWYRAMGWARPFPPEILRVWGVSDSPNILAALINVPLMLIVGQGDHSKPLLWLWLALALPVLVLTGSRGGWLAAVTGLLILKLDGLRLRLGGRELSRQIWLRFAAIAAVAVLSLLALTAWLRPQSLPLDSDYLSKAASRVVLWPVALAAWGQRPWPGTGPNTYLTDYLQSFPVPPDRLYASPHNLVLAVLGQMGLVGLAALLYCLILFCRWLRREWWAGRWSRQSAALTAALTCLFIQSQLDAFELRPQPMILGAILLAALLAGTSQLGENAPPPSLSLAGLARPHSLVWLALFLALMVTGFRGWQVGQHYTAGAAAVEAHNWPAATNHFRAAQSLLPYPDTSLLWGQGFTLGVQAAGDVNQLQPAVTAYEQVIRAEPGWALNHANLAALYWQQGQAAEAIATMKQAADLAPEVPFYHLNLGLWYESLGETESAQAAYEDLYQLEATWREAPFWQTTPTRQRATAVPLPPADQPDDATRLVQAGRAALAQGQLNQAADLFHQALAVDPDQPGGHFGLGVIYFQSGRADLAADAWQRAAVLDRVSQSLSLDETPFQQSIALWQSLLPDARPGETQTILAKLTRPSVFGYGRPAGNYLFMAFVRLPMAAEIQPQLRCLPVSADLAWHLNQLRVWYVGQGEREKAQTMEAILRGDEDGLASCGAWL